MARPPLLCEEGNNARFEQAEAEGNEALWEENAARMMEVLIRELPKFIRMNKAAKSCE